MIWRTVLIVGLLSGCTTYQWRQGAEVDTFAGRKIESPLAAEFCSTLLGGAKRGCAIRIVDTATRASNCVFVVLPGDAEASAHEAAHCVGLDHP